MTLIIVLTKMALLLNDGWTMLWSFVNKFALGGIHDQGEQ